ncbi:MAG TPA: hypothetical protein VMI93_15210 [Candidatus Solibacter sp.]|nr:hypothetical protein [Candidatus Solibacter sp.]
MNSRSIRGMILTFAASCAMLLAVPALRAQQDATPSTGQGGDQASAPGGQNAPGPVGGVEAYRFPGSSLGHSFIVPRLSLQEVYDTNAGYSATSSASQGDAITTLTGGVSLQWLKRNSTLSLDYDTAGLIYNTQEQPNGLVQHLGVTEKVTLRRWNLLFGENFSYSPNSIFGLGGLGYLGNTTGLGLGGVTGFNPSQIPTQTIVSPNVSQFSSASAFQAQYFINGSSSVNGSVIVGFLHFFDDELLNTRTISTRIGYDRSFSPRDTISLSYLATLLDYPSGIPGFTSHYIQLGYRRILTGRLQLTVSAGPSISQFTTMTGQTTVPGGSTVVDFALFSSLDYKLRDGALSAQYTHSVGGGSGYFVGSITDQFTGNFSRHLTRVVSGSLSGGYARNESLQQTSGVTGNTQSSFNTWFAGGSISRPIGHYSSISFAYNASRQTSNTTMCANMLACGPIALVQVIGVTFNWSTRPFKLE